MHAILQKIVSTLQNIDSNIKRKIVLNREGKSYIKLQLLTHMNAI